MRKVSLPEGTPVQLSYSDEISIEFDDASEAHALDTHLYRRVLMDMREFLLEALKNGTRQFSLKQIKTVLKTRP